MSVCRITRALITVEAVRYWVGTLGGGVGTHVFLQKKQGRLSASRPQTKRQAKPSRVRVRDFASRIITIVQVHFNVGGHTRSTSTQTQKQTTTHFRKCKRNRQCRGDLVWPHKKKHRWVKTPSATFQLAN